MALVLTGYLEGDVIRHTEIFAPLRALDLPVGHTVMVLGEMGIFEDASEPSFERWIAERLEGLAPGIRSEARRALDTRPYAVLQPLIPEQVDRSVAAATTPATPLILALAAVHAAQIANLMPDDVDLGSPPADRRRTRPPARRSHLATAAGLAGAPAPPVADHREPPPADQQPDRQHDEPRQ